MGIFDRIEGEASEIMKDPQKRAKVFKIANEQGITIEAAKKHFMKHGDN